MLLSEPQGEGVGGFPEMQATTVEDGRGISGLLAIICGSVSTDYTSSISLLVLTTEWGGI